MNGIWLVLTSASSVKCLSCTKKLRPVDIRKTMNFVFLGLPSSKKKKKKKETTYLASDLDVESGCVSSWLKSTNLVRPIRKATKADNRIGN